MFTTYIPALKSIHGRNDTSKASETDLCLSPGLMAYLAFLSGEYKPVGSISIEKYVGNVMDQIKKDYGPNFIKLTLRRFIENVPSHLKDIRKELLKNLQTC